VVENGFTGSRCLGCQGVVPWKKKKRKKKGTNLIRAGKHVGGSFGTGPGKKKGSLKEEVEKEKKQGENRSTNTPLGHKGEQKVKNG